MNTRFALGMSLMIALAAWSFGAQSPATQPVTQLVTQPVNPEVEQLIAQLGDDQWRVRQAAQEKLVKLGQDVAPRLGFLLQQTQDEEVRTRAEAALRAIEENDRTGPTLITLHLKDAPLQVVINEISKQAKVEIATWPPFEQQRNQAKVTVDADREPFWSVVRQVCQRAGLAPERMGNQRQITLMNRGDNWSKKPSVEYNGFLIIAESITRNHTVDFARQDVQHNFSMHLKALIDPKIRVLEGAQTLKLEEVSDDKGHSLIPPANNSNGFSSGWGASWIWDLNAQLHYQPDLGKRMTRFKATAKFMVQTKTDTWEIPDVLKAQPSEKPMPVGKYVFRGMKKNGENNYEVQITIHHSGNLAAHQSPLTNFSTLQQNIRLVDANGRSYSNGGGGGGGGGNKLDYSLHFYNQSPDGQKLGEPAKIVWDIPLEIKEIAVPVEFKDLLIP